MPGIYTEPTKPIWACIDCYMLHCNGETDPNMTEDETAEFLERYARGTAGAEVTAGMFAEYHGCQSCAACGTSQNDHWREQDDSHDYDPGEIADDCECEQVTFSWSPCGICGSNLGGTRSALTLWYPASSD